MLKKSWVVAANSTQVRLFHLTKEGQMVEMDALINPENRMREQDLVSDRHGNVYSRVGRNVSEMESPTSAKKSEAIHFAKYVANFLEAERGKGGFERLYIAASPSFLGLLRSEISHAVSAIVEKQVDKDITHLKPNEIRDYFIVR